MYSSLFTSLKFSPISLNLSNMKKNCELCKCVARVYCESDQASLCWSCDAKVHSANFLVARHVRSLLCYLCQTQTPWSGSGHKLGRTISVCEPCVKARVAVPTNNNNNTQSEGASDENSESGIDYDSEDNQVVPLSSSSSSETHRYRPVIDINISPEGSDELVADLKSKDDLESSSPRQMDKVADEDAYIDSSSLRPFKFRKLEVKRVTGAQNNSTAGSRIQLRRDRKIYKGGAEAHECVDLDLNECPI